MTREEELFSAAAELPMAERAAFLKRMCADDTALGARVEALLSGHEAAASFLREPLATLALASAPFVEEVGTRIDRYKLLEKIGEGGCGVVWVAEQNEPVRRRVALKVIKLGMDTREVIARFEAERQALALMEHPNIARVLDGGATASGRPYFVMELVRGMPITRYCDEAKLTPKQRLELFISVCSAVQHAHQKGIIHRDLKPSNILVTVNDGVATPKVIDFGIAKATQGSLTEKTLYTAFQQFIGTPTYMSPEQADLSSVDIDTRSDIYSLGVLLYELLTGAPPFDSKTLLAGGVDEIRRIIREVEPARPSTRVATLAPADRGTLSRQRSLDAHELSVALRGDLDWIVMRCLEKDRSRRYETANALVADLRRHLAHEPVVARPPSASYRFRKFARRNRLAFVASVLVFVSLVTGLAVSIFGLIREKEARQAARRSEQLAGNARQNAERLLTFIVTDHGEDLDQLGQFPTLRKLNSQVLSYYEQLSPALRTRETRAGYAFARTGLASVGWFNADRSNDFRIGEPAGRRRFEEALREMEELEKSGPLTPFIRVAYAGVLWGMVGQCYQEGHARLGLPLLVKAESLLEPVLADAQWSNWADGFAAKILLGRGFLSEGKARADLFDQALKRAEDRDRRGVSGRRAGLLTAEIRYRQSFATGVPMQVRAAANAKAQEQLREILAREPFLAGAQLTLANALRAGLERPRLRWQFDACRKDIGEAIQLLEHYVKHDPNGTLGNIFLAMALASDGTNGRFHYDWLARDFRSAEAGIQTALRWFVQPHVPPQSQRDHLRVRFILARLFAATDRDAEANQQLIQAGEIARKIAEERPWLTSAERLDRTIEDETARCKVEMERLNWALVRAGAERILQAGRAGIDAEDEAEGTGSTSSTNTARHYLMQAAFETGDYATARRELDALSLKADLRQTTSAIESRFQRVRELLTRIHVLARAGELATARADLDRIWSGAEEIFEKGKDHLFVQIEHARALSIRAEVEAAEPATKRVWLERAVGLLRPAAAAGRLTRYERVVLLRRIEQQLAAMVPAVAR